MKFFNIKFLGIFVISAFLGFGCSNQTDSLQSITDVNQTGNTPLSGTTGSATVPEFFEYAIIGGEETTLNGAPIVVKEAVNPQLNANVHSNNEVILNGETILINGFATYVDNIIIDGDSIRIMPNSNPDNLPPYYQVSDIDIPVIDVEDFKQFADIVYNGDKELSGVVNLGTQSDPLVIYVTENLYLDNVEFNGYGVIFVEDEVDVVSNAISRSPNPDYSKVFIVSGSKFIMNNSSTSLHAAVYSKDEINVNAENIFVSGSLATLRKNTLNGDRIDVRYKPVFTGLSELVFGASSGIPLANAEKHF
jgi:hypothetical protein